MLQCGRLIITLFGKKFMRALLSFRLVSAAASLMTSLWLVGCVDGDVSKRDDGKRTAAMGGARESGLSEAQANEAALRLIRENPGMSRKEANQRARASVPSDTVDMESPQERKKRLNAEAQDKFETELAKMEK